MTVYKCKYHMKMPSRSAGNVLFLILIAVVLFAALSYAVTSSSRQGGGGTDQEKVKLNASELLQYATVINTAVTRLKLVNGCSNENLSFESPQTGTLYENTNNPASDEKCHIFSAEGGGVSYQDLNEDMLDSSHSSLKFYGDPIITGSTQIYRVGTDSNGVDSKELILIFPYLTEALCREIAQETTGLNPAGGIPRDNNIFFDHRNASNPYYKGTFPSFGGGFELRGEGGSSDTPFDFFHGAQNGCMEGKTLPPEGTYHYFHVLVAR
mgnify:CR=1 FL=1